MGCSSGMNLSEPGHVDVTHSSTVPQVTEEDRDPSLKPLWLRLDTTRWEHTAFIISQSLQSPPAISTSHGLHGSFWLLCSAATGHQGCEGERQCWICSALFSFVLSEQVRAAHSYHSTAGPSVFQSCSQTAHEIHVCSPGCKHRLSRQ